MSSSNPGMADSEPSEGGRGSKLVLEAFAAADSGVQAASRTLVTSGRSVLTQLQSASAAAKEKLVSTSTAAQTHWGELECAGRHKASRALVEAPEAVVAATTLLSCVARGVNNGSVLGRAPVAASATALLGCFLLREPLAAKFGSHPWLPKREDLKAVGAAYAEREQHAIDAIMGSGHAAALQVQTNSASAQAQYASASDVVSTGMDVSIAGVRRNALRALVEYPEVIVVVGTLATCVAHGSRNGTLLGNAPRRAAAAALLGCFLLHEHLAARWQPEISAASRFGATQLRSALGK